ncbi:hypothetical protein [Chryseobacterium sp.]|uniref:hypothetical protein n=1 Tax=Chryseobacterium sp. TaxID=1871047 RepID=UPI0025C06129|nr:hypothetical protein [Chryseobacterium sp.]
MKASVITICMALVLVSCGTAKNINSNLPKDISERPFDDESQKSDHAVLTSLRTEIETKVSKEKCTDPEEWTFSPMGSKACGGPQFYITYPKKLEAELLPKIEEYTKKEAEYNKRYSITSDCMLVSPPEKVVCNSSGTADLVNTEK